MIRQDCCGICGSAARTVTVTRPERLAGIFDDRNSALFRPLDDGVDGHRDSEQIDGNHRTDIITPGRLQLLEADAERLAIDIAEARSGTDGTNGVGRSDESESRSDHLPPRNTECTQGQDQTCGATTAGDGGSTEGVGGELFQLLDGRTASESATPQNRIDGRTVVVIDVGR